VAPLLRADEVWVPTAANRASFAMAGVPPARIRVVPEPLDPDRFDPETTAPDALVRGNGRTFVFLSVFDWSLRKGPDLLLRAFAEEFRPGEAELVLKVHSSLGATPESQEHSAREIVARACGGRPGPAVRFVRAFRSPRTMPSLYAGADAFVLATRGEGWGRTIHEAMASAIPVIATCAGATATLVGPPGVAYPVAATLTPVPDEALAQAPDYRGQSWWEPSVQSLRSRMREVFEDRAGGRATGARGREHVRRFTPKKVVDLVLANAADVLARCAAVVRS
jgi:glycosyltransferase involved in cell wall biosynthesis